MEYKLIRSRRRSLGLEVTAEEVLVIRAPMGMPEEEIRRFISSRQDWLEKSLQAVRRRREAHPEPTPQEQQRLIERAKAELPPLVMGYAVRMGVQPTGLTITGARKRFGSCSAKNRLRFSWRLMQWPQEAIEYVVVHELAHIRQKNHGPAFYREVEQVLPDYKRRWHLLKE